MNQNYGVLRVVRVMSARSSSGMPDAQHSQAKHPTGWLPEEGLVHVLTRRTTAIGRALHNDVILMDPTVSREHARLILDQSGWHIVNLTEQNVVRVNGRPVPGGRSLRVQTQDIIVLGNTMLQFGAFKNVLQSLLEVAVDGKVLSRLPADHLHVIFEDGGEPFVILDIL